MMKLYNELNATDKSAAENWHILNKLQRHITIHRATAVVTYAVAMAVFVAYGIAAVYSLLFPVFLHIFPKLGVTYPVLAQWNARNIFTLIPLPWYATILAVLAGWALLPPIAALITRLVTKPLFALMTHETNPPLPTDDTQQAKTLSTRVTALYHAQNQPYRLDMCFAPYTIGTILFGAMPIVTLLYNEDMRAVFTAITVNWSDVLPVFVSWIILVVIMGLIMLFPSYGFMYLMTLFDIGIFSYILRPIYHGCKQKKRADALENIDKQFYQKWLDADPEERKRYEEEERIKHEKWLAEKRRKDEYWASVARELAEQERQAEDERRRFREWCEDDGIDWSGSGDGI